MNLRHQFDTLVLYDPDRSVSTVNVWVAHPTPPEESVLGTLFIVSAIASQSRLNHEVLGLLQDEVRHQYYDRLDQPPELAFEQTLQKTNQRLHQLIAEGVGGWVEQAHILIGSLWRDRLAVTTLGTMTVLLIRRDRLHDVLGGSPSTRPNPLRLFDHVVSGQLEAGDRLIICTPSLLDYFSLEKLRRLAVDHTPSQAVRLLESTLLGVEPRLSFAALMMHLTAEPQPALTTSSAPLAGVAHRPSPQLSMAELVQHQRDTEHLLSPSIWPAMKDLWVQLVASLSRTARRLTNRPPKRSIPALGDHPGKQPRSLITVPAVSSDRSWSLARIFARLGSSARSVASGAPFVRPSMVVPRAGRHGGRAAVNRFVLWFQALAPRPRALIVMAVILLLLLTTAVVRQGSTVANRGQDMASTITNLEERLTKAEAALLYGGEEIARQQLAEAETLLAQLPHRKRADQERVAGYEKRLGALRNSLRHLTFINQPPVLVAFAADEPSFHPSQLYHAGPRLVMFDPDSGRVLVVELNDPTTRRTTANILDTGQPKTAAVVGSTALIFSTDRNGFVELDLDDLSWRPLDARYPQSGPAVQFVSFFQNRVYVLDRVHGQIIRFQRATNTLGTGSQWLRESVDLRQARAAVVDGSIYVLQPNGVVEAYFGGRRTNFQLETVDPPLTDPIRLWTDEQAKYLYLLEPATKRLVVFDKRGQLVDQYQSAAWTSLSDVVADESKKTAYLVSDATVYQLPLQH
ncbi:MAG: hypothetical protein HYY50_03490 [Candidatus Kerfeldbacteria bacterium]|nr:hypothetical protein [Candidatus Kerfeldbacteria bacterium]